MNLVTRYGVPFLKISAAVFGIAFWFEPLRAAMAWEKPNGILMPAIIMAGYWAVMAMGFMDLISPLSDRKGRWISWTLFGILGLQILAGSVCIPATDGLCFVWYMILAQYSGPIMVALALMRASLIKNLWGKLSGYGSVLIYGLLILVVGRAFVPRSAEDCRTYENDFGKDACLQEFAEMHHSEQLCLEIVFDSSRATCLRNVAALKKVPEICDLIAENDRPTHPGVTFSAQESKDLCYLVLARDLQQRDICSRITEADKREQCLNTTP